MSDEESIEIDRILADARAAGTGTLPLAEVALALAFRHRSPASRSSLGWYRTHLAELAAAVAAEASCRPAVDATEAAGILADVLVRTYGYVGDHDTYDDPDNADLARVIDRRRGLPVALGVLWIDIARRQEWEAEGLGFPGHFLLRLGAGGERIVVDAFHGGIVRSADSLRGLIKAVRGPDAELAPADYEAVSDRSVLVRLVANIRLRALQENRHAEALEAVVALQALVADDPLLWRESGILRARLGQVRGAIADFERFLAGDAPEPLRHEAAALVERLKLRLL